MQTSETLALAPDVGTTFEYGLNGLGTEPASFRVNAWLRVRPWRASAFEMAAAGAMVADVGGCRAVFASEIVAEIMSEGGPARERLEFCLREVATHVCGSGVAGCVAAISAIHVTGVVEWSPKMLEEARSHAILIGRKGDTLC